MVDIHFNVQKMLRTRTRTWNCFFSKDTDGRYLNRDSTKA